MNIAVAPKIRFGKINLEDENITRKLIVGLLDRGVVSMEAVLDAYGEDFLLEIERMKEQQSYLKYAGAEIKGPYDGDKAAKKSERGRPILSPETSKRDTRTAKPRRTNSYLLAKATNIIELIDDHVVPIYMLENNVKNARMLTNVQKDEINEIRSIILSSVKPDDNIDKEYIISIAENPRYNAKMIQNINNSIKEYQFNHNEITLKQRKLLEALEWSNFYNN